MKKVISKNLVRNQNSSNSKLCAFSSLDYIVLASTLAVALGEELSSNDVSILAAVDVCSSSEEEETFTAPTPDVAVTRTKVSKTGCKSNPYKKKIIKKRIKRKKTLD